VPSGWLPYRLKVASGWPKPFIIHHSTFCIPWVRVASGWPKPFIIHHSTFCIPWVRVASGWPKPFIIHHSTFCIPWVRVASGAARHAIPPAPPKTAKSGPLPPKSSIESHLRLAESFRVHGPISTSESAAVSTPPPRNNSLRYRPATLIQPAPPAAASASFFPCRRCFAGDSPAQPSCVPEAGQVFPRRRMPLSAFGPRERASCALKPDKKSALIVSMGQSTRPTCLSGPGSSDGTIPVQRAHPS
jgi:hypothetical protein